jgi:hypothetical protein
MIDWLERRFEKFAIPNLTIYLIAVIAAVSGSSILFKLPYVPLTLDLLFTSQWWQVVIFPFRVDDSFLWLFITLYMLFFFGSSLEADMGDFRYNLFILIGVLSSIAAVLFLPYYIPPPGRVYIYIAVFLAVTYRSPDTEILIFFILPVKLKFLAYIVLGLIAFSTFTGVRATGSAWPVLSPIVALANLIIFFGPEMYRNVVMRGKSASHRAKLRSVETMTIHRCHICGITEREDPQMDFRYCAQCTDHEYCRDHLENHEHIRA